jgi:hypothetical protein
VDNVDDMGKLPRLYRTSDIYFAAYLCSLDFPLQTTERDRSPDGKGKVVFVFKVPDCDLGKVKSSYFGGSGTVKARKFVDNIRSLKQMCFT